MAVHGFSADGARKVAQATRVVLSSSRGGNPGRGRWPVGATAGTGVHPIKTTSAVTARSSTTPGSGTAVLISLPGSTVVEGGAITVRNLSATAAGSGKYGFAFLIGGVYWLGPVEC
jgi:hypothetical protein